MHHPNLRQFIAKAALACVLLAASTGCALHDQMRAARDAIPAEQVPGIRDQYAIGWGWPEPSGPAWREFSDVQAVPFEVYFKKDETATRLFVVEGKDAKTGKWRVIYAAKLVNNRWVPVQLSTPATPAATSRPVWPETRESQ
jgi:hypothetical protein